MTVVLVPHAVTTMGATIWVGVFGSPTRPSASQLVSGSSSWAVPQEAWEVIDVAGLLPAERRTTWTQSVTLDGLQPGRRYDVACTVTGQRATCRLTTLPQALPRDPERPFTILLGSCFASFQDQEGLAGLSVGRLPDPFKPDLKILCGDQVYLDNPWYEILPRDPVGLAERLYGKYVDTWAQGDGLQGFSALLAEAGTIFLADDHEFWNNHPNWSPLLMTRTAQQREEWIQIATALFASFQATEGQRLGGAQSFSVGSVEFYAVDTRFGRTPGDEGFMDPGEFDRLIAWLDQGPVDRPGVLILGAPIFTTAASWFSSKFADRSLANYRQYAPLAEAILASKRSLLVLAGDVHFGRVATAPLASGATLVELVASPLALVDKTVGRDFHPAPSLFPVKPGQRPRIDVGTLQWTGWTGPEAGLWEDHFTTFGLTETDQSVRVRMTAWQVGKKSPYGPIQRGTQETVLPRRAT